MATCMKSAAIGEIFCKRKGFEKSLIKEIHCLKDGGVAPATSEPTTREAAVLDTDIADLVTWDDTESERNTLRKTKTNWKQMKLLLITAKQYLYSVVTQQTVLFFVLRFVSQDCYELLE